MSEKNKKFLIIIFILFLIAYAIVQSNRAEIAIDNQKRAAKRQIQFICHKIYTKVVSVEELCSMPIIKIESMKDRYNWLLEKDGEWYESHGWSYFPEVDCEDPSRPVFGLMDYRLACQGSGVEIVEYPSYLKESERPDS